MKVLDESKRREEVPCKSVIHPVFSTSFGLHVAVLTADSPPKFIFARRANRGLYSVKSTKLVKLNVKLLMCLT